ncbi:MAG: type IV pilin protein [Sulfuricaulis sp.]
MTSNSCNDSNQANSLTTARLAIASEHETVIFKKTRGFTLIELLITVVIIGILSAIAYPSYVKWITSTRRTDGQVALTQAAAAEEKFFAQCNTYAGNFGAPPGGSANYCVSPGYLNLGPTISGGATLISPNQYYNLTFPVAPTASSYTISAAPVGAQLVNDTLCGTLTIDQNGNKTQSSGSLSICWQS